ncbi:MAG TPA: LPXTG cell wall anchor domain-containing protein [Anaerolineaceae bacterium]|nr:LPXTG cell wall anchor domain-containing protein [Anaerolineaceae bacterium]HPN51761.1 LPXTG cell wall anchor domain-containing protein [Anaerolineaceae bacterium]
MTNSVFTDDNGNNDDFDLIPEETPSSTPPPSNNRAFIIAIIGLGVLFVLAVLAFIGYDFLVARPQRASRESTIAAVNMSNTATVSALTAQAVAVVPPTATATSAPKLAPTYTATPKATNTPVVAQPTPTNTQQAAGVVDPRTATVSALLTQAAVAKLTATVSSGTSAPAVTSTALPNTGFADEVGLPGLLGVAALLVVVIFIVRRMRTAPTA